MFMRLALTLVCVLTLAGCEIKTAPSPTTPSTVTPVTPPMTPPSAVVRSDTTPIATLLGKPVLSSDCLSPSNGIGSVEVGLHSLILGVLMHDFYDPHSLTLSQSEIDAVWQRFQAARSMGGKTPPPTPPFDEAKAQARLDDVHRKLAAPKLGWLDRLTLQDQERGSMFALEHKSVPVVLVYEAVMPMRSKAELYKKFGGKVVAMQISIEPAEAYVKLVQEAEASGKLQFHDETLKQAFWKRMNDVLQHTELPPERVDFSLPVWLQMAGAGSATPPAVPAPVAVAPTEKNLITDPSLETTALGERYPASWGTGNLIPPNAYQHQVVEGGRTGQRGWMIEGDGQYAVVPTNRPQVDRAFRYAARGWVKLEAGSAQLKILYFDGNGRYIGENRSAVTNKLGEWQQLTTTDDLASWPDAGQLSLALSLIGTGKAVFDDLEFTAFDSQRLPPNFETEYAFSPKHDPAVFDRWVGRWESTTKYQPTATTEAKTIKGETIVRKVLDDRFLLWQWASETGDAQYMSLLGFDENFGGYRFWTFGSGGEAFERTGQWDAASQTLKLDAKPPTPGVTGISTDRFVGNDQIESTLLVKNAAGQLTRDMQATWVRKAATVSVDIDFSSGPVAGSEELAVLQKMAGDWTNHATSKPSVWEPAGKTETFTEQVAWTIGGRFLIFRAYDETKRMTSLSLMTYEPKESSYRFWYFAPGVYGGQWRITWDAASREFHWNSIDMPAGWTGTGINRLIDDDTFANQALIKDEQGRVLMDATQDKRRKSP